MKLQKAETNMNTRGRSSCGERLGRFCFMKPRPVFPAHERAHHERIREA